MSDSSPTSQVDALKSQIANLDIVETDQYHTATNNSSKNEIKLNKVNQVLCKDRNIVPSVKLLNSPIYRQHIVGEIYVPIIGINDNFYGPTPEHKLVAQFTDKAIYFYHKYAVNDTHICYLGKYHEEKDGCLCFTLSYIHIWGMWFYNTRYGMFNSNPHDYFLSDITNFMQYMQENKNIHSPKNENYYKRHLRASSVSYSSPNNNVVKKILNKLHTSKRTITSSHSSFSSTLSMNEDDLCWPEDNNNSCFVAIEYRGSFLSLLNEKKYFFKLTKDNASKIHYFICNGVYAITKNTTARPLPIAELFDFDEFNYNDRILTKDILNKLKHFFKPYSICAPIFLGYSTFTHGTTLSTLYNRCQEYYNHPCILIIKDNNRNIFGATLSNSPNLYSMEHYFGDGSCCVFRCTNNYKNVDVFRWSYETDYYIVCHKTYIAIGGSENKSNLGYALWINQDLRSGTTDKSTTFKNPPLSTTSFFNIIDLEVWIFAEEGHPNL